MGLSEDELWGLTLREYCLLVDRWIAAEERADLRTAQIASLIANIYRDEKKKPAPYTPKDFMPDYAAKTEGPKPQQTWQRMKAIVKQNNRDLGGREVVDVRGRDSSATGTNRG